MDRHLSSPLHSVDATERKLSGRPDTNESRTFWATQAPFSDAILAVTRSKCLMFHLDVAHGWKLPRRRRCDRSPIRVFHYHADTYAQQFEMVYLQGFRERA